ncbi:MAG: DUF4416 family protein [bacterium]
MKPQGPDLVKLFVGILYSDSTILADGLALLDERYGEMDYRSKSFAFTMTDYYVPEMGSPITRMFVSFDRLIHPKEIARIKCETNDIENQRAVDGKRKINLDPGYMDYDKVVLASAKYNGQKIYLDHGIWADLTLHFEKGRFDPYAWSFPDFKEGIYDEVFLEIRQRYKMQRKENPA